MSTDATAPDFTVVMRGYDRGEVDHHLARTAATLDELRARIGMLERQLADERAASSDAAAAAAATAASVDHDTPPSERFSALGEETTRILVAAEESAREMREKAAKQAEAEIAAAERAARERVDTASEHATRIVAEAEHRRNQLVRDMAALTAEAEAELERLRGVRGDLVGALRTAVATTTAAVGELAPAEGTRPAGDAPVDGAPTDDEPGSAATSPTGEAPPAVPLSAPDERAGDRPTNTDDTDDAGDTGPSPVIVIDATDGETPTASAAEERATRPSDEQGSGPATVEQLVTTPAVEDATAAEQAPTDDPVAPSDDATAVEAPPAQRAAPPAAPAPVPATRSPERHGAAPDALRSALADATVAADVGVATNAVGDVSPALRREQALAAVRPGALRRLRRGLQDLQNGVLQRVRQRGDGDVADALPAADAVRLLADIAQPFLDTAYRSGIGDAAVLAGGDVPTVTAVDGRTVLDASDRLARELVEVLRTTLLPSLRAGADAGEPDASLSERVGEVFRDLKGPVVETVADRQLTRTYGTAALARWRAEGIDEVVWMLGEETRCPEGKCRGNAAEGPVAVGRDFPSGHTIPPVHDGCTCALAPAPAG